MNNFKAWWAFCQAPNRDGHANDEADDGAGPTRWGFTYPTYVEAVTHIGGTPSMTDFMTLEQDKAGALAKVYFWDRSGGGILPAGSDVSVVDWSWTSGGAVRDIQTKLGVVVDGIVGPVTVGAVTMLATGYFSAACCEWRRDYYDKLGFRERFPGLYDRADDCLALAMKLEDVA